MKQWILSWSQNRPSLFLVGVLVLALDLEVPELVRGARVGDDVKPVAQLVLLEELLGQVLEVPLGERRLRNDCDDRAVALDLHGIPQLAGLAVDLDAVVQELLESARVHDAIIDRLGAVDGELEALHLLDLLGRNLLDDGHDYCFFWSSGTPM